jgi:hypothetical protein
MKRIGLISGMCLVVAAMSVTGCERARSIAGLGKQPPDEFSVVTRAPLSLPPDYGLRPPTPGAQRPQEKTVRNEARQILLRNSNVKPNRSDAIRSAVSSGRFSPGEAAFLSHAGALNADPSIRRTVDQESTALAEATTSVMDKVLFWREVDKPGIIVDPKKESRRLREARAMGDAVNKGKVPTIERKQRGILEGIF